MLPAMSFLHTLTGENLESFGISMYKFYCIVAADALVPKHQAISNNNTSAISLVPEQFHQNGCFNHNRPGMKTSSWRKQTTLPFKTKELTHWGWDKMADIFPDDIFKHLNENVWISNTISMNFVSKGPIGNNTALVHYLNQWWLWLVTHTHI